MAKSDTTVSIAVAGYQGCSGWIAAGLIELFAIANVARRSIGIDGPTLRCELIARRGSRLRASHGVQFDVTRPRRRYAAIIVPPLWCSSLDEFERIVVRLERDAAWLRLIARRTNVMASACSGAVLLAQAGLLDGYRATTCWWLADWFARRFPGVDLAGDQLVVRDRDRWSAAAGTAYMHLGLELVKELAGPKVAAMTGRLMLVERRRGSQSPFLGASPPAARPDGLVDRAIRWFAAHPSGKVSVAALCGHLAVTERTLARRFHATLGMTPLQYLQSRRVAQARALLESTDMPFDAIVERCGYQDVSSFRKLFARHVGMPPREYRSRFAAPET